LSSGSYMAPICRKLFTGWGRNTRPQVGDFQVAIRDVTHDELIERGLTEEEYALLDEIWAEMDANPRPLEEVVTELRAKGISEYVILAVVINEKEVPLEDGTLVKRRVAINMMYDPNLEEFEEDETSGNNVVDLKAYLMDRRIKDELWIMIRKAEVEEKRRRSDKLEADMRSGGFPERLIRRAIAELYPPTEGLDRGRRPSETARSLVPLRPKGRQPWSLRRHRRRRKEDYR
jgi:hypothetical protein